MKILFVSRWFPYPTNNGSKLRIFHLIRGLATIHDVSLLCFTDLPKPVDYPLELKKICKEIRAVEWKEFQPDSSRALVGLFSVSPRALVDTYSDQMAQQIKNIIANNHFDLVICSQWMMTAYHKYFGKLPVLFEEIEVGLPYGNYVHAQSRAARLRNGLTWWKYKRYLAQLLAGQQPCTVVSDAEKQLLSKIVPENRSIHVIPNCINLNDYADIQGQKEKLSLIFTGSFRYRPNYEAMVWFLEEVFPGIQAQLPDVQLTITGDHMDLPLPASSNVSLTGFIPDVRPYIAMAQVSIAPLRMGGGTRLKILEAMALGTPVVSTSKGAEGLQIEDGNHLLLADDAKTFVAKIVRLLQDPQLQFKLSENALAHVRQNYDWAVVLPRFLQLAEEIVQVSKTAQMSPI